MVGEKPKRIHPKKKKEEKKKRKETSLFPSSGSAQPPSGARTRKAAPQSGTSFRLLFPGVVSLTLAGENEPNPCVSSSVCPRCVLPPLLLRRELSSSPLVLNSHPALLELQRRSHRCETPASPSFAFYFFTSSGRFLPVAPFFVFSSCAGESPKRPQKQIERGGGTRRRCLSPAR